MLTGKTHAEQWHVLGCCLCLAKRKGESNKALEWAAYNLLILTIDRSLTTCTSPTGRLARSAEPPLMALFNHPISSFLSSKLIKKQFGNIHHVSYCRRIKCGNESWRV